MSAHTPGPWMLNPISETQIAARTNGAIGLVAVVQGDHFSNAPTLRANARLIAAAPDLLEALQIVTMTAAWSHLTEQSRDLIQAAIAKATGQTL